MLCHSGWGRDREASLRLNDLELWLVWRGKGWMRSREHEYALLPGFCALMRPGGLYDAGHDEANPLAMTFIHFDLLPGDGEPQETIDYRQLPEFFQVEDFEYFDAVTRRIVELHPHNGELAVLLLKALLMDLLQRPSLGESPRLPTGVQAQAQAISRLAASLRAAGSAPLPTVPEMARQSHLTPGYFSRIFRKVTGQSPRDFLVQTRLAQARHLLVETDLRIGEIAERLDYADVYFFSRQFKAKTGMTPSDFRTKTFLRQGD